MLYLLRHMVFFRKASEKALGVGQRAPNMIRELFLHVFLRMWK